MQMEFSLIYSRRGIIAGAECEERQIYHSTLEEPEQIIKKDLVAVFRQMKNLNTYLRISTGADCFTQKQALCITQNCEDVDLGIYSITTFDGLNTTEKKACRAQAVRIALDIFWDMVKAEEHRQIMETA